MVVGDDDQFIEKYALEFAEMILACYPNPYAYPHKIPQPMDVRFFRYGQDNSCPSFF